MAKAMGFLLKDALKTICSVNQWSYAVFWKIGCQNPKLLIWEDCYYKAMPNSVLPSNSKSGNHGLTLEELEKCLLSPEARAKQLGSHVGEQVHLLVNKMMMVNQVHVVGEGLVGRTAFSGNHQWIVSGNFNGMVHPPEVVKEIHLQFSAGMQTVAVIPVIPHGVIQLGSSMAIRENVRCIQYVKTLLLQLECVPSALLSNNCMRDESVEVFGLPFSQMKSDSLDPYGNMKNFSSNNAFACGIQTDVSQNSRLVNQTAHSNSSKIQDNLKPTASTFQMPNQSMSVSHGSKCQPSTFAKVDSSNAQKGQLANKVVRAEVMPLGQDLLLNQNSSYDLDSGANHGQAVGCSHELLKKHVVLGVGPKYGAEQRSVESSSIIQSQLHTDKNQLLEPYGSCTSTGARVQIVNSSNKILDGFSSLVDQPVSTSVLSDCLVPDGFADKQREKDLYEGLNIAVSGETDNMPWVDFNPDFDKTHYRSDIPSFTTSLFDLQSSAGDDLYDALGMDLKRKVLNGYNCNLSKNRTEMIAHMKEKSHDLTSSLYPNCDRLSESGMFSASRSDHLLDAVVSGVHSAATQSLNDNLSCKTTVTNDNSSSAPSISPMFGHCSIPHQMRELFGHSKTSVRSVDIGATSTRLAFGKNDGWNCVQTSSFGGSCISSCVEQGPIVKHENTVATANSKKINLAGKPIRRRLKPGENPRPRPKDRQMIQDRVKELREIIPNGAKCSIDALLERTIKHMLFLQSVAKHADKLKQTAESKITNKDGGLLLKDNFERGATWAYEVGSQARICPIVVEDLNPPRQLLVEMFCEQRGFFLEIADIIRGMGLTILKGVMETRNDKIWARFAVEANRDVTRVELFFSLVHLLDHTVHGSNNAANYGI